MFRQIKDYFEDLPLPKKFLIFFYACILLGVLISVPFPLNIVVFGIIGLIITSIMLVKL